jgi:hypothetical protein
VPLVWEGEEMSRLLPVAKAVSWSELQGAYLFARIEQVEWWKRPAGRQDIYLAFHVRGPRGTAWVSVDGESGETRIEGWLD